MAAFLMLLVLGVPLAIGLALLIFAPPEIGVPVALVILLIVALVGYAMSSSVQWVELDGGVFQWKTLLTRRVRQNQLCDLVDALPLHSNMMGPLENAVMDFLRTTSNRGFELRFRDGTRLGLVRGDMTGLDEFLGALAEELARLRGGQSGDSPSRLPSL
jgi:hypothetical protein